MISLELEADILPHKETEFRLTYPIVRIRDSPAPGFL